MTLPAMLPIYENEAPFFSVVLCTFNRAHLLPRALDSLMAQEETSWEAVIVDDGSIDNTAEVVRPFALAHANVRYLYHSNRGLPLSRNTGIAAAVGRYVTFLDSDDAYTPDHLRIRRAILESHPEIDLLHGGVRIIGNPYVPDKYDPDRMLDLHDLVVGGTYVMPRATLAALGGFPVVRYSIDSALYEKIEAAGLRILKTDAPTYLYDRTTPDSICNIVAQGGIDAVLEFRRQGSQTRNDKMAG
jgi:glycosyltransferase involved in cell wall biosynthesis